MDKVTRTNLDNLWSEDREMQNKAFFQILEATDKPVDWAYDVWDEMIANLSHKDNHNRAIAAQILCNLAKSDPRNRMLRDLDALLAVTRDERFVTAQHCLQSMLNELTGRPSFAMPSSIWLRRWMLRWVFPLRALCQAMNASLRAFSRP